MWTDTQTCIIRTATKTIMELICIITGSIMTLVTLYILFQQRSNSKSNNKSIQQMERMMFLIHSLLRNIAQILMFGTALYFNKTHVNQQLMSFLMAVIGWCLMGGTLHAIALWFFILPLRFLRQRPSMIRSIGVFFDYTLRLDVLYFCLFLAAIVPTFLGSSAESYRLTINLIHVLIFFTLMPPIYLILLAAGLLHETMHNNNNTNTKTSNCLRLVCNLMCFKRTNIQPKKTSESSLSRRRSSNIDQVTTKLKFSVILLIVLGFSSLGFSLFVVLFDVAYFMHDFGICCTILCLIGCPWELIIYFMFFRKQTEPSKNKQNIAAGTSGKETYKTGEVVSNTYVKTNSTICTLEDEISHARRNSKTTDTCTDTQENSTTFTLEDEISHARRNSTTCTLEDEISHARSNSTAINTIEDISTIR